MIPQVVKINPLHSTTPRLIAYMRSFGALNLENVELSNIIFILFSFWFVYEYDLFMIYEILFLVWFTMRRHL